MPNEHHHIEKRPFTAPTLIVYGDVRTLTAKATTNITIDSATGGSTKS